MSDREIPYRVLAEIAAAMPESPFVWEHTEDLDVLSKEWHELLMIAGDKACASMRRRFSEDARQELLEAATIVVSAIAALDYHSHVDDRKVH